MARLLVTRPQKQGDKTAFALIARGHEASVCPMLDIVMLDDPLPAGSFEGILATSTNAVLALAQMTQAMKYPGAELKSLPLLATGSATAAAASKAGFEKVSHVSGSAHTLAQDLPQWLTEQKLKPKTRLLYPSASVTARDMSTLLKGCDLELATWIAYRADPRAHMPKDITKLLRASAFDGVLLYSARSAAAFAALAQPHMQPSALPRFYVLSGEIAAALPKDWQSRCFIAEHPNEASLFDLIDAQILKNGPSVADR